MLTLAQAGAAPRGPRAEPSPNLAAAVDGAAIPEQVDGTAQMPEQVVQERADVEAREIVGATAQIESAKRRHPGDTASPLQTDRRSWR